MTEQAALKTNTKLSTPTLWERFCLLSPPTPQPGKKVKRKGGHLEGPLLEAGLGKPLGEQGMGDMQVMGMYQREKSPV